MAVDNYILYLFIFKILTLCAGMFSIYLGYRLFCKGVFSDSGEMEGSVKTINIKVKRAAPGTLFSLFGCIIVCYAVFTGFTINYNKAARPNPKTTASEASEIQYQSNPIESEIITEEQYSEQLEAATSTPGDSSSGQDK